MPNTVGSFLFVNGRLYSKEEEPAISALDRGFTLGDGLFETMRASHGSIFRLSHHLARLHRGASVLKLPLPPENELVTALQQVLSHLPNVQVILRLTITRGPDRGRGISLPAQVSPTIAIRTTPSVPYPEEAYRRGFHAAISPIRRNESSPLSRIKSCNYGDAILAREEAQRGGYDEAILLNSRGEVACATTANIFIVREGKLWTPPEESGVLPGITRACTLELASALQLPAEEAPFDAGFLLQADEVFLSNTVTGIMPMTRIEEQAVGPGRPGPITQKLAASYRKLVETEISP